MKEGIPPCKSSTSTYCSRVDLLWIRRRFLSITKESSEEIVHNDKTTLLGGTSCRGAYAELGRFFKGQKEVGAAECNYTAG